MNLLYMHYTNYMTEVSNSASLLSTTLNITFLIIVCSYLVCDLSLFVADFPQCRHFGKLKENQRLYLYICLDFSLLLATPV